jgi:peptidoglycan/LPS O-acetylase OafA/YrhL
MSLLFFAAVFFAKSISLIDGLKSYFASIFYSHNLFYPDSIYPILNAPAWSLEIEIQFYILAPILAYCFSIKKNLTRRLVIVGLISFFLVAHNFYPLPFRIILSYIQYFLLGFLLVDLYISKFSFLPKTKFDNLIAMFLFIIIWLYDSRDFIKDYQRFAWESVQLISIFFLYYYILFNSVFKTLSLKIITNVGGMCYSIYLLHGPIISLFGNFLIKIKFTNYLNLNILICSLLLIFFIMIISSIFFLVIERPCMDKDWYKKILKIPIHKKIKI